MFAAEQTQTGLDIFVSWGGAVLVAFGIIGGLAGFAAWLMKRIDARITLVAHRLDERTQPIQPDANGGLSLPDVVKMLDLVTFNQRGLAGEVRDLSVKNDAYYEHLQSHIARLDVAMKEHVHQAAADHDAVESAVAQAGSTRRKTTRRPKTQEGA